MFITVLTTARHSSPFWARLLHSTPCCPIDLRSIFLLSSHLRIGLLSVLFSSWVLSTNLTVFLVFPPRATWPAHLILRIMSVEQHAHAAAPHDAVVCSLWSFTHSGQPSTSAPPHWNPSTLQVGTSLPDCSQSYPKTHTFILRCVEQNTFGPRG